MNHDVRAHLMSVLAANGIPDSLLAELMKERRTLRDSIAIAALPALIQRSTDAEAPIRGCAAGAYHLADAMLAERDGPKTAHRKAARLTEEQVVAVWKGMPGGPEGWLKSFGFLQFAEALFDAQATAK